MIVFDRKSVSSFRYFQAAEKKALIKSTLFEINPKSVYTSREKVTPFPLAGKNCFHSREYLQKSVINQKPFPLARMKDSLKIRFQSTKRRLRFESVSEN